MKLKRILADIPIYPIWFGVYPLLYLWSVNPMEVAPQQLLKLTVERTLLAGCLLIGFRLLLRSWHRSAVATSIMLILLFQYGIIFRTLSKIHIGGFELFRHRTLLPLCLLAVGACCLALKRFTCKKVTVFAYRFCVVLILFFLGQTALRQWDLQKERRSQPTFPPLQLPTQATNRPNVVVIMLDEYARADALKKHFNFDNSLFLNALEHRGFVVLPESVANYHFTIRSLGSSLNMDYWPVRRPSPLDIGSQNFQLFQLQNNRVISFFKRLGYQVHTISACTATDHMASVDQHVGIQARFGELFDIIGRDTIEAAFISKTHPQWPGYLDEERGRYGDRTLRAFEFLKQQHFQQPTFVFLHVLCPHKPLVFKADGSWIRSEENPKGENYIQYYPQEVEHLNKLVLEAVDTVLKNSPTPPIIIVMSDHGTLSARNPEAGPKPDEILIRERMGNLCALYFPNHQLKPSDLKDFSLVNLFRLVLNVYFNAELPLLPRKMYWNEEVTAGYGRPENQAVSPGAR